MPASSTLSETALEQHGQMVLDTAKKLGAQEAEITLTANTGFDLKVRNNILESLENQIDQSVTIKVYRDNHLGAVTINALNESALFHAVEKAIQISKLTHRDPNFRLADAKRMATRFPDLDLVHPWELSTTAAIEMARACEARALNQDSRITQSEGVQLSSHTGHTVYSNTHGFIGHYAYSRHSNSSCLIAKTDQESHRDYAYTASRNPKHLQTGKQVANHAVEKTVSRLGARNLASTQCAVLLTTEVARELIRYFLDAINGANLYHKTSFLLDCQGKKIFSDNIQIHARPHLAQQMGSMPYDLEGVATQDRSLVEDGQLLGYQLNSYYARKLGLQSTGNAGCSHNICITPNARNQDLLNTLDTGLLITATMGQGVNLTTGDYSKGAFGYWVSQGEIQFPVHGITLAGNLRDMFMRIQAVGDNIDRRTAIHTGSLLIDNMTIGGSKTPTQPTPS